MGPVTTPSEELVVADDRGTELEPATRAGPADRRSRWRRLDKKLLIASLVIAFGVVLIGYGVEHVDHRRRGVQLPAGGRGDHPGVRRRSRCPQQITIVADLEAGYFGYLTVDGVELPTVRLDEVGSQDVEPGEQVEFPPGARFEPGNATLTFTPGSEQDVDTLDAGVHTVKVVYWKEIEGPETARSYSWTFTVV